MTELLKASLVRNFVSLVPQRLRYRAARFLYNPQRRHGRGAEVVVDYLGERDLKFLLNTREHIGWNIFFWGGYEQQTNALLRRCIRADDIVVEVGANNGSETVLLGRLVGPGGRVHAFEPVPHVARQLKINLMLNVLEDIVDVYLLALGEHEDTVRFFLPSEAAANQGMSSKWHFAEANEEIQVQQTTLDQWSAKLSLTRLDFVKMDIQGAELDLLKGGSETIKRFEPVIFTEADETAQTDGQHTIADLWRYLRQLGYSVFDIQAERLVPMTTEDELAEGNWLAVPLHRRSLEEVFVGDASRKSY